MQTPLLWRRSGGIWLLLISYTPGGRLVFRGNIGYDYEGGETGKYHRDRHNVGGEVSRVRNVGSPMRTCGDDPRGAQFRATTGTMKRARAVKTTATNLHTPQIR